MGVPKLKTEYAVREMRPQDLDEIEDIFEAHISDEHALSLEARLAEMLAEKRTGVVALVAVDAEDRPRSYLVGEVRAWEFGSEPAGWIFALGVDPALEGRGLGRLLRDEAIARFRELGVHSVRTMVRKDDVRVQRFFRDAGFVAGPFQELELALEKED